VRDLFMTEQQYWSDRVLDWNKVKTVVKPTDDLVTPIVETKSATGNQTIQHPMSQFANIPTNVRPFRLKQVPVGSLSLISR
jgi:hypothetical protein